MKTSIINGSEVSRLSVAIQSINEQLHAFEQATEREMNREMQSLGNALLSISKGFVGNYEKLIKDYQIVMGQLQALISANKHRG